MTSREPLSLGGCTPIPLAAYLKAVGVLRLLSSAENSATGSAADPLARGWWSNERFHLLTTLDRDGLLKFFLEEYAPTPIMAPWNGGSGFYPKDNKDGFGPLSTSPVATRFDGISSVIRSASEAIARSGLEVRPDGTAKVELLEALRGNLTDAALGWMDAALVLTGATPKYPQLLGTGGNDGRLDFTNNFMRHLVSSRGLFDAESGAPSKDAARLLETALFDIPSPGMASAAVGQFAPGPAGGPNATTGFDRKGSVNPWDFVLMLEGSVAFAGAATRRHQSASGFGASFPFTVRAVGAGDGGVGVEDEQDARAEFWAPLWANPARFMEIDALLSEGRAVLNERTARDGLEFARAVASLGTSRGFSEFERYGFFMRSGKAFLATPIGRGAAGNERSTGVRLMADLDAGGWLDRVRHAARQKEDSAAGRNAIKQLEDALFELVAEGGSSVKFEGALVALGRVAAWLAISPKGRVAVGTPPPLLSRDWMREADDGSPEFRVAAALAGIGLTPLVFGKPRDKDQSPPTALEAEAASADTQATGKSGGTDSYASRPLPMAAHLVPIDERQYVDAQLKRVKLRWSDDPDPSALVWGTGSLVANLNSVLERRLLEMGMRGLPDKPLAGALTARLEDVTAFLLGDFDDSRCSDLLRGLIWAKPAWLRRPPNRPASRQFAAPFAYAALKPLMVPNATLNDALRRADGPAPNVRLPVPPGLIARLRTGGGDLTGKTINEAVRAALARARASGMASPFDSAMSSKGGVTSRFGAGIRPDRLAAALLIPIGDMALKTLLEPAYPQPENPESNRTEDTNDGN